MRSFFTSALAVLVPLSVHAVATYEVRVGVNESTGKKGTGFDPSSITAVQQGDIVQFVFTSGTHSARESTFETPCMPKDGAFDSGPVTVSDSLNITDGSLPSMTFTMQNMTSLWFFDQYGGTCKQGGVFSINPTFDDTDAKFKAAASTAAEVAPSTTSSEAPPTATATGSTSNAAYNMRSGSVGLASIGVVTLFSLIAF